MDHPFLMFLDHTQWRTTVGRTPLDEWSAHRRDLYLTTHDTHNRQISMPPVGLEPTISSGARRLYFAKLLRWDLLIYVCYKIVRFVDVCHFIPCVCVCVSVVTYWVKPCQGDSMTRFHSVRNTRHTRRRNKMTYGHKLYNFITNVYQQIPS